MSGIILPDDIQKRFDAAKLLAENERKLAAELELAKERRKRKGIDPAIEIAEPGHKLSEDERKIRRMKNKQAKFRRENFRRRKAHGRST